MKKSFILAAGLGLFGVIQAMAQEEFIKPPANNKTLRTGTPVPVSAGFVRAKDAEPATGSAQIRSIRIVGAPGGVKVVVEGQDLPKPGLARLAKPLRVQLIFSQTKLRAPRNIKGMGLLRKIRSAEHKSSNPPLRDTWIVLDLLEATSPVVSKTEQGWSLFLPGSAPPGRSSESTLVPQAEPEATPNRIWQGYRIVDLEIKEVDKEIRIILTADGKITYRAAAEEVPPKIIIDFLGGEFNLPEDSINAGVGAVGLVQTRQIRGGEKALGRLIINLTHPVPHRVNRQSANQLVVSVSPPDVKERVIPRHLNIDHLLSLDAQNQDLEGLVRTLIDESGGELIVAANTQVMNSTVTQKLRDVPLWRALDSLLIPYSLSYAVEGDVINVGPVEDIKKRKVALMARTWETEVVKTGDMPVEMVINMLTGKGKGADPFISEANVANMISDKARNQMVVRGLPEDIREIKDLINRLGFRNWESDLVVEKIRIIGGTIKNAFDKITPLLSPGNGLIPSLKAAGEGKGKGKGKGTYEGAVVVPDDDRNEVWLKALPEHIEEVKKVGRSLGYIGKPNRVAGGPDEYETRVISINWKEPSELVPFIKPHMSNPNAGSAGAGAKIQIDAPSRRLVITDFPSYLDRVEALILELDTPKKQVIIEAKLVEFSEGGLLSVGVDWSGTGPSIFGKATSASVGLSTGEVAGAMSFGVLQQNINLSSTLTALETQNIAEVISSPRIATQDGVMGSITSSLTLVYEETTTIPGVAGSPPFFSTEFKTVELPVTLKVTPRINDMGYVDMQIFAEVTSQAGPQPPGAPPPTSKQTAETLVTVKDGDTIVIGGLIREEETLGIRKVPLLSAIPILGRWLFQSTRKEKRKVELVIFLTPHIMTNIVVAK